MHVSPQILMQLALLFSQVNRINIELKSHISTFIQTFASLFWEHHGIYVYLC